MVASCRLQSAAQLLEHQKKTNRQAVMAAAPYSVQLDPETARSLATNGAAILLLDVPLGTPIGVDQQVFLTGPKFKGLKMLPPGPHLLSYQALAADGRTLSPPVSTFFSLQPRQVVVRRWDAASEGLVPLADEEEEARYAAGVARFDFDAELAPYDLGRYSQWVSLTCYITEQLLDQLLPADREISIMAEAVDPQLMTPATNAERRLQQQLEEGRARLQAAMQIDRPADACQQPPEQQPEQQQQQQQQRQSPPAAGSLRGGRCHYTQLPRLLKVPGATAAQLTALNMDKTALLEQVLARYSSSSQQPASAAGPGFQALPGSEVLGELQFAFAAFVFGQSLEGYMHWKQLLVLLLGCVSGPLETHTQLFVAFLAVATAQLQMGLGLPAAGEQAAAPAAAAADTAAAAAALLGVGGLVDELLPDSFLRAAFRGFFEMLQEEGTNAPAALVGQARVLESVLAAGLGWDFRLQLLPGGDDDDDEEQPVVVELSEQQLAALGLEG